MPEEVVTKGSVSSICERTSAMLLSNGSKPAVLRFPVELELLRMLLKMLYRLPKLEPDMPISPSWTLFFSSPDTCTPM